MSGGGGGLSGPDSRGETISRLAQWRVDTVDPCSYRRSDPFKLGIWNWYLSVEKSRSIYVRLFPEPGRLPKEQPPLARFVLRVSWAGPPRRSRVSPVLEQLLRSSDDFAWQVDVMSHGRFTIDVEFLDLRVATNNASILSFSTYQSRKNPAYFFRTFDRLLNAVTSMNWKIHQVSIPSEHLPSANIMLM